MKQNNMFSWFFVGTIFTLIVLLTAPSAFAVIASADEDTITFKNEDGSPFANQTIKGLFEGEEIEVTTDDEGKVRICRREKQDDTGEKEEDKKGCGLFLLGDGSGKFGDIDFTFKNGNVDIGFWDSTSTLGKAGIVTAIIAVPAVAIGLASSSGNSNNDSKPGPVSGNLAVRQILETVNPQGSCAFVNAEIGRVWPFVSDANSGNFSLNLKNGLELSGTLEGNQVNLSGSGVITGVPSNATATGTVDLSADGFTFDMNFGPPLGGGPSDECRETVSGSVNLN